MLAPLTPTDSAELALGVMLKYWDPGKVKTRLAVAIGDFEAAEVARLLVRHSCLSLAAAADHRELVLTPNQDQSRLELSLASWHLGDRWSVVGQGGGDLGERMSRWFKHTLSISSSNRIDRAILVGTDCPTITPDDIEDAGQRLGHHDVVIGPATDGGYYLIGLRLKPNHSRETLSVLGTLFDDMPWSTDRVLSLTHDRCRKAGLSVSVMAAHRDIDTADDLTHFRLNAAPSIDSVPKPTSEGSIHLLAKLKRDVEQVLRTSQSRKANQ